MVLLKYRFSTSAKYQDSDLRDGPMWALVFRLVFQATRTLSDEFVVFERSPSRSSGVSVLSKRVVSDISFSCSVSIPWSLWRTLTEGYLAAICSLQRGIFCQYRLKLILDGIQVIVWCFLLL